MPPPPAPHTLTRLYVSLNLYVIDNVNHIKDLGRHDAHRGPFQLPYLGPYEVISKGDKSFKVRIGNREEHISIDPLKPAHLNSENPPPVA